MGGGAAVLLVLSVVLFLFGGENANPALNVEQNNGVIVGPNEGDVTINMAPSPTQEYVAPSVSIQNKVKQVFNSIERDAHITFVLWTESGDIPRNKVAQDIEDMVSDPSIVVYPRGNTNMGTAQYAMVVTSNPKYAEVVAVLTEALGFYLSEQWHVDYPDSMLPGTIKVGIVGTPLFYQDGRVEVR